MRHMTRKTQNDFSRFESRFSAPGIENKRTSMKKSGSSLLMLLNRSLYRIFEITAASVFIVIASLPVLICMTVIGIASGRKIFETCTIYGKDGIPLQVHMFSSKRYYIRKASLFFYVFTGKLRLIGWGGFCLDLGHRGRCLGCRQSACRVDAIGVYCQHQRGRCH